VWVAELGREGGREEGVGGESFTGGRNRGREGGKDGRWEEGLYLFPFKENGTRNISVVLIKEEGGNNRV